MKKHRYVCFDLDGIIIDSEPAHFNAFRTVLKGITDITLTQDSYTRHFAGKTDRQGFVDYFASIEYSPSMPLKELIDQKSQIYSRSSLANIQLYLDTVTFLKTMPNDWHCALVTSSSRAEVESVLDHFNLRSYFRAVVTVDDVTYGKPSPEGYTLAAKLLGVTSSQCIAIEDSPSGIRAALLAGMKCIALTTTHEKYSLQEATIIAPRLSAELFTL